jgi:transcriptional regulator with XRE-family HTH domain
MIVNPRDKLRRWRSLEELTQNDAADLLYVYQSQLSDVERGARVPGLRFAVRIEELTGIRPAEWVRNDETKQGDEP